MSVFVLAPDVALTLSKAKHLDTGSNVGLLDATGVADGTTLAGVPVLVSTDVAAGNAWGLDSSQVLVVQRTGTQITCSVDAAFDYDAVQVRVPAASRGDSRNPPVWCVCTTPPDLSSTPEVPAPRNKAGAFGPAMTGGFAVDGFARHQ